MGAAAVPAQLRQQVDRWADTWLKAKFARLLELRALDPGPFNYPIAVFSEWRGKAFYLCVDYSDSRVSDSRKQVQYAWRTEGGVPIINGPAWGRPESVS